MTHFLMSDENPAGYKLEDILATLRCEILTRCQKIAGDTRPEAREVMANNVAILGHVTEAIALAEASTRTLDRAFGRSQAVKGGPPRIGDV